MKNVGIKLFSISAAILMLLSISSTKLIQVHAISEEPIFNEEQTLDPSTTNESELQSEISDESQQNTNLGDDLNSNIADSDFIEDKTDLNDTTNKFPVAKIIVYGGGKVTATPDTAYITVGVESVNQNLQNAIKENNDTIISIIEHLKTKNISENDIKTKYYTVYQARDYSTSEKFQEYHVKNTIEYKTNDLENLGETISELTNLGANLIEDIQFDCSKISECYKEALKLALEDAKSKAAGFTDKELTIDKITEECVYTCMPYRSIEALTNNSDTIKSGNIEVEAKILVVFK